MGTRLLTSQYKQEIQDEIEYIFCLKQWPRVMKAKQFKIVHNDVECGYSIIQINQILQQSSQSGFIYWLRFRPTLLLLVSALKVNNQILQLI